MRSLVVGVCTAQLVSTMWRPQLLVVVFAWAVSTGVIVLADIVVGGPYAIDLESFAPCEDIGSFLIDFDVEYVFKNDILGYNGNLTFPYDEDDEDLLTTLRIHMWGSTGGWKHFRTLDKYDIMEYLNTNFPRVFESFYGSMGITGKPMPAGTYYMENFNPMGLKLENVPEMLYGHFRIMAIQSKNGTKLGCLQFEVNFRQVASKVAGKMKKRMQVSG